MSIPLLIVEDEPPLARRMQQQLAAAWPEADLLPVADNGASAIALALEHLPRAIFLDIHLPACSGLDAAQAIIEASRSRRSAVMRSMPSGTRSRMIFANSLAPWWTAS